ncbi:MAG: hypothetical protein SGCHY_002647 [Lobulomycetales sp.]
MLKNRNSTQTNENADATPLQRRKVLTGKAAAKGGKATPRLALGKTPRFLGKTPLVPKSLNTPSVNKETAKKSASAIKPSKTLRKPVVQKIPDLEYTPAPEAHLEFVAPFRVSPIKQNVPKTRVGKKIPASKTIPNLVDADTIPIHSESLLDKSFSLTEEGLENILDLEDMPTVILIE